MARGEPALRRLIDRIDSFRLFESRDCLGDFTRNEMHVGQEVQRLDRARIHTERLLGELLRLFEFERLQREPAFAY